MLLRAYFRANKHIPYTVVMKPRTIRLLWPLTALPLAGTLAAGPLSPVERQATDGGNSAALTLQQQQSVLAYWTAQKMREAIPMKSPPDGRTPTDAYSLDRSAQDADPLSEPAGYAPGWNPRTGPLQPAWDDYRYIDKNSQDLLGLDPNVQATAASHATPPSDPLNGPYPPFQRRSLLGRYLNYPRSVVGKLFFTLAGNDHVCSGVVIQRNTVATAGHCNYGGPGFFASNRIFCPSYNQNGVNPTRGCWTVIDSKTNNLWQVTGDPDRDHACLITAPAGDTIADSIGNVTGWVGRAFNWGPSQPIESFGYAANTPFDGSLIIQSSGPEWYEIDFSPSSPDHQSKCIGSDVTDGADGGPWLLAWNNPIGEIPDSDNNEATDPGGAGTPLLNGIHSHRRCADGNCATPPGTAFGLFWQENCSPPFRHTIEDVNESEDVFEVCFNNGGA